MKFFKIVSVLFFLSSGFLAMAGGDTVVQEPRVIFKELIDEEGSLASIQKLKDDYAREHHYSDLSPRIQGEVIEAFKTCGILQPNEPVKAVGGIFQNCRINGSNETMIVLQNEAQLIGVESRCTYQILSNKRVPVLVLDVGESRGENPYALSLFHHDLYHECGHLVNGDTGRSSLTTASLIALPSLIVASIYAGKKSASLLKIVPKPIRIIGGIGVAAATFSGLGPVVIKGAEAYERRLVERKADIFAAQKLVKKDIFALILDFSCHVQELDKGMKNPGNDYWFLHDHPGYHERAQIILDEFKRAKIDFRALPLAIDATINAENVQKVFIAQVEKHFPEYLTK